MSKGTLLLFFTVLVTLLFSQFSLANISIFDQLDHRPPAHLKIPAHTLYEQPTMLWSEEKKFIYRRCEQKHLDLSYFDPSTQSLQKRFYVFWQPKRKTNVPTVIILTNSWGETSVEQRFAKNLCAKGYATIYMKGRRDLPEVLSDIPTYFTREVTSSRAIIDYLESHPEKFDASAIGVLGVSYGAMVAPTLMGVEPRIKAGVVVAGGADVADILANSQYREAVDFREDVSLEYKLQSTEEFAQLIRESNYIDNIHPDLQLDKLSDKIYQLILEKDAAVKTENQWLLWEAMGRPEYVHYEASIFFTDKYKHELGILAFSQKYQSEVYDFFQEKFY